MIGSSMTDSSGIAPELHDLASRGGNQGEHALAWRFDDTRAVISSASVGGGIGCAGWVVNIGVGSEYRRTDLATHAHEVQDTLGLTGEGSTLFTAADVSDVSTAIWEGVRVDATVGISKPTWAADVAGGFTPWKPGTINIVAQLPVALDPGAAVGAVITVTEAKTQALVEAGVPGTGTASDAVVICWPGAASSPTGAEERFAGPRSEWGARLALAVHNAVHSTVHKAVHNAVRNAVRSGVGGAVAPGIPQPIARPGSPNHDEGSTEEWSP